MRKSCRRTKEDLHIEGPTVLHLDLPGDKGQIEVSRAKFNEIIKPPLSLTTDALTCAIGSAV